MHLKPLLKKKDSGHCIEDLFLVFFWYFALFDIFSYEQSEIFVEWWIWYVESWLWNAKPDYLCILFFSNYNGSSKSLFILFILNLMMAELPQFNSCLNQNEAFHLIAQKDCIVKLY